MSALGMAELRKRGLLDGCHDDTINSYEHFVFNKHERVKFSPVVYNTESVVDNVHADLWGASHKTSNDSAQYMLTIIDDYLEFDLIFLSTNQMHLSPSRLGRFWLICKPRER
jgi:hypothetical protein